MSARRKKAFWAAAGAAMGSRSRAASRGHLRLILEHLSEG
jgi:hypothetical protein